MRKIALILLPVLLIMLMGQVSIPDKDDDFFLRGIGGGPISPTGTCDNRFIYSWEFENWDITTSVLVESGKPGAFGYNTGSLLTAEVAFAARVGALSVPAMDGDTIILSAYIKNSNMLTTGRSLLNVHDITTDTNNAGYFTWTTDPPEFSAPPSGTYITGGSEDAGEGWSRIWILYDSASAGTEGDEFDAKLYPSSGLSGGDSIYADGARMESGDGITEPEEYCATPVGSDADVSAISYPTITSAFVVCDGTDQELYATTNIACLYRYRYQVSLTEKPVTSTWSSWTGTASASFFHVLTETPVQFSYFQMEIEAKTEDSVPATNNPQYDAFQWGVGGACP